MGIFDTIKSAIPQSAMEVFVRTTDVASYMPGRVRLYSRQLVNNAALEAQVQAHLGALAEIEHVDTNIATGSILITYDPERLRANAELRRVEDYMRTHARRKAS
ncbi:HMA2 domain-containing protein [Selenomonas dianae]|uniref:Cation transporter n=1 Tax=Selenomonas dianae TaxID=135079 RepID=A0ABN0T3N7_9FIRM|nr:hypothetical protein [Selenomonas dianae]WLD82132.1 hypothetical protein QU667_10005 [Selenomonas dianae]